MSETKIDDLLPRLFVLVGVPGAGKTTLASTAPKPVHFIDAWGGTRAVVGEKITSETPPDIDKLHASLMRIRQDPGDIRTLVLDTATGVFALAKRKQLGDPADASGKGDWGLRWNEMMGRWNAIISLASDIVDRHPQITFILTAHIREDYLYIDTDSKGQPTKRLIGWKIDVPGSGNDTVMAPFDEVYHLLVSNPNAAGINPQRKLMTVPHLYQGFPVECKARYGPQAPIDNPTWDKIIEAAKKRWQKP